MLNRRVIPSIDQLRQRPGVQALVRQFGHSAVVEALRAETDALRQPMGTMARGRGAPPTTPEAAAEAIEAGLAARLRHLFQSSLCRVINATGVIVHTNLGRAPLSPAALAAVAHAGQRYVTLEYDLARGERGHRDAHAEQLLCRLTGAESAVVVNNCAAATMLMLAALASGREVIVSRGELVEIGGSFRIPDILAKSGARLREVGTTNRTHLEDYRRALGPATGAILRVHQSNFQQAGYVHAPSAADLAGLARAHDIPFLHDIGSGLLADLSGIGLTSEPRVPDAVADGADLVIFSGDKLLGGPQAGCLVGRGALLTRCRTNPLARAARADKLTFAALEATLELYRDPDVALREVPVLRMLTLSTVLLARAAERLVEAIAAACPADQRPRLVPGHSVAGGGSFPGANLPTTLVLLDPGPRGADALALALRLGHPAVIARVAEGAVVLDPRTRPEDCFLQLAGAVASAYQE